MEASALIEPLIVLIVALVFWVIASRRDVRRVELERETLRAQNERIRGDLDAVVRDRDGWREAAMRATLIAEVSQGVTVRATRVAETVVAQT